MDLPPAKRQKMAAEEFPGYFFECRLCARQTARPAWHWRLPTGWRWHRDEQGVLRALCKECRWRIWRDAQREMREDPLQDQGQQGWPLDYSEFYREVRAAFQFPR